MPGVLDGEVAPVMGAGSGIGRGVGRHRGRDARRRRLDCTVTVAVVSMREVAMPRAFAIVVSALLLSTLLAPGTAGADGAWLDAPPAAWNQPGMAIPQAPVVPPVNPACFDALVVPDSPAKQALVAAGWFLFNPQVVGPGVEILSGQSSADGMCRPTGYQSFVFVDGTFAGTLSPMLMDARSDGALVSTTLQPGDAIEGRYVRYTSSDPLCCPSANSTATFKIDRSGAAPVVVLQGVRTEATGAPTPPPSPSPAPSPAPATATPARPPVQAPAQVPRSR